ncbi:MAG TPA: Ig-like domain-containing protein [Candidatus Acidoferrum sp.]|jgi:hypothetical protein|nr:Ig-like domain-containing protein [Candidatus Acidoferrum sp.]
MPTPTTKGPFVVCPKSGRIVGFASTSHWRFLWIPWIGLAALLWILFRVVPKPSRANYPCQQAAIPLASGFLGYVLSFPAAVLAYHKGRQNLGRARYLVAGLCFLTAAVAGLVHLGSSPDEAHGAFVTRNPPNTPLGTGHGIFPGRVAWIYDPAAVSWEGAGNWHDDAYNNQIAIDGMVSQGVRCVGGQAMDTAAWDALFHSFNRRTGRGDVGYARGEKIAIKINENNVSSHANNNNINASPHMVLAVLRQLIKQAGVAGSEITVFDASRFITDNVFDKCHAEFPSVVFVDHEGGDGRVKATFVTNAIPGSVPSTNQKDLATCDMEAKYIINLALLKGHVAMGVTLCAKNFFGVTAIETDWHKNGSRHHGFDQKRDGTPSYMAFADYLGHPDLGGKTLLYMIDSLYGSPRVETAPATKWKMAPFNNGRCASVFLSEDGVAIDSVGIDFLISEFPSMPDLPYCDNYLQEAAQANDPPSHTVYNPDGVHVITDSLGIAEHWNNPNDKQYSRNLSPGGAGIELIAIQPELNMGVAVTSPAAGATVHPGQNVRLTASVTPGRASVSKVEYYCNGKAIGVSSASPYTVVWSNAPAGTYSITAVATDTDNFSGLSAALPISVRAE